MNRNLKRPVALGAAFGAVGLVAVLLALSLTGGSAPTASATTTSSATGAASSGKGGGSRPTVNATQAWHNLAQCIRSHGYAIADPTVNADGTSSWSGSAGPPPPVLRNAQRAIGDEACSAEYRAIPPQFASPPPTQAQLHSLVLFAGCMRDHGLADWPDPNSEGAFPLNARLLALGKRGIIEQLRPCSHFNLGNGIAIAGGPKTAGK